jgi:nuclear-control-of-ATPase protein 2
MMFQRGPEAFVQATCQALTSLRSNGSPSEYLLQSASDMFETKVTALKRMQRCLAVFLSKVCYSDVIGFSYSADSAHNYIFLSVFLKSIS